MSDKERENKKPAHRFLYNEDDVAHIFRLGDIGTVFNKKEKPEDTSALLKKMIPSNQKTEE
jgi:hypothetical protein